MQHKTPAFEQFFYQAVKDHILVHGRIDAEEAAWLRQQQAGPEFQALFAECMKQPPEQRTCG